MNNLTVKVLTVDAPTINGRIYPKDVMEEAIKNFNDVDSLGGFPTRIGFDVNLENVTHKVKNVYLEKDTVYADIELLENNLTKQLFEQSKITSIALQGSPIMRGRVDENMVSDLKLVGIDLEYAAKMEPDEKV